MGVALVFELLLLPVLMTYAAGPSDCGSVNVTIAAGEALLGGGVAGYEYSSSVVEAEFIVTFVSYYTAEARAGFISAALRPYRHWSLVPRPNAAASYPSDFSVVRLASGATRCDGNEDVGGAKPVAALGALRQHPTVKRISPQKRLTKILAACEYARRALGASGDWSCDL